jgi:hypothetical protein
MAKKAGKNLSRKWTYCNACVMLMTHRLGFKNIISIFTFTSHQSQSIKHQITQQQHNQLLILAVTGVWLRLRLGSARPATAAASRNSNTYSRAIRTISISF